MCLPYDRYTRGPKSRDISSREISAFQLFQLTVESPKLANCSSEGSVEFRWWVGQALPSGERLIAEMDQPDAAETAAAVSTSAGVAGEAHQPAPPGQQVDAEAAGLASSQSVDVQTGNAHSTTENEPAMAERSGDAKQKPSRRELKPLVQFPAMRCCARCNHELRTRLFRLSPFPRSLYAV